MNKVFTYGTNRISEDQLIGNTWTLSFYGYDGQGSVRYLSNAVGQVTDTYDYDAFGNLIRGTGTTPNEFFYDGEQLDANTSFYNLRARWMNTGIGRFQTMDSYEGDQDDPLSLHKYQFSGANPVNNIDPGGNEFMSAGMAGGFVSSIGNTFFNATVKVGGTTSDPEVERFKELVRDFNSSSSTVDFTVLVTLAWSESGYPTGWNSNAGPDVGIMQIRKNDWPKLAVVSPDSQNISNGAYLLSLDKTSSDKVKKRNPPYFLNSQTHQPLPIQITPEDLSLDKATNGWFIAIWFYKGISSGGHGEALKWDKIYTGWPDSLDPKYQQLWNTRSQWIN